MDTEFKRVIFWSLYILTAIIAIFTFIALGINVLAPTFFPNANISGFKDYINTFCIILSFLSVGLGVFSIIQANESSKQVSEMTSSIQALKQQQEIFLVTLKSTNNQNIVKSNQAEGEWQPDNIKS